jgi:hypothetical protein
MDANSSSCVGCKFLCRQDHGYSNYTVTETEAFCAKSNNPNLPADEPYNWILDGSDMWPATNESRCASFVSGDAAYFDVDGETTAEDYKDDPELYAALKEFFA